MKKILLLSFLLLAVGASAQVEKAVPARPEPPVLVNDLAGLLSRVDRDRLESRLVEYDKTTSNQVAIVILKDLGGYEAAEYATALGRKWGVGGSRFNNGVVVLISTGGGQGQRDAFIATGYGLEGAIPDITAKKIVDHSLIPYLKKGDYYSGLDSTVTAIMQAAAGEYTAPEGYGEKKEKGWPVFVIIAIIVLFIVLGSMSGGDRGGGYVSRRGYRGWGGWLGGGWIGSGGGGWSGGRGSSGGGGFGGFGGGSFGGGGAGGKW